MFVSIYTIVIFFVFLSAKRSSSVRRHGHFACKSAKHAPPSPFTANIKQIPHTKLDYLKIKEFMLLAERVERNKHVVVACFWITIFVFDRVREPYPEALGVLV